MAYRQASEDEAESAIRYLRRVIEAAENSNQAGENAAVRAAMAAGWKTPNRGASAMTITLDRMLYIVIVDHRSGLYLPERNLCDIDRKTTIKDIATGQIEDVVAVHEYNPAERTSRDVTEDIMSEAAESILKNNRCIDLNDWQRDFVARQERRAA